LSVFIKYLKLDDIAKRQTHLPFLKLYQNVFSCYFVFILIEQKMTNSQLTTSNGQFESGNDYK